MINKQLSELYYKIITTFWGLDFDKRVQNAKFDVKLHVYG